MRNRPVSILLWTCFVLIWAMIARSQPVERSVWFEQIRDKIRSRIQAPASATNELTVTFSMNQLPNGEIMQLVLEDSSGSFDYDRAMEMAIVMSAPLPAAPSPEAFTPSIRLKLQPDLVEIETTIQDSPQGYAITQKYRDVTSASTSLSCQDARGETTNRLPIYPAASRRKNEEGKTTLRVYVDSFGYPVIVGLRQSSGFKNLDRAAIDAVRTWCFLPARTKEKPVGAWVLVPIIFKFDESPATSRIP